MTNDKRAVLDASAVLALRQGEPGSEKLRKLLAEAVVSAVNKSEVVAKLVNHGMPGAEAQAALDALHLEVTAFDAELAALSTRYVRKRSGDFAEKPPATRSPAPLIRGTANIGFDTVIGSWPNAPSRAGRRRPNRSTRRSFRRPQARYPAVPYPGC